MTISTRFHVSVIPSPCIDLHLAIKPKAERAKHIVDEYLIMLVSRTTSSVTRRPWKIAKITLSATAANRMAVWNQFSLVFWLPPELNLPNALALPGPCKLTAFSLARLSSPGVTFGPRTKHQTQQNMPATIFQTGPARTSCIEDDNSRELFGGSDDSTLRLRWK